ncbi:ribonuclease H-like domain-containing protein, partial [Mycena amicta]
MALEQRRDLPYAEELGKLLRTLKALPQTLPVNATYDFIIEPTAEELDDFGSPHGVVNRALERAFGPRNNGLVQFTSRGPLLEAVVQLLRRYITGKEGQNVILMKWVDDLTEAAEAAITETGGTLPRIATTNAARRLIADNATLQDRAKASTRVDKGRKELEKVKTDKAKVASKQGDVGLPLERLEDLERSPPIAKKAGKPADTLMDECTIKCTVRDSETPIYRWRCSGVDEGTGESCRHNWAHPRASGRIYDHAADCKYLPESLRARVREASSAKSLGARAEAIVKAQTLAASSAAPTQAAAATTTTTKEVVDPFLTFRQAGKKRNQDQLKDYHTLVNHRTLKMVCDTGVPLALLDNPFFRDLINLLDPNNGILVSTTFSTSYIPFEAARVTKLAFQYLQTQYFLTITFDGGSLRRPQSVYTVHITVWTPYGRVAYFVHGDEASGVSHTGKHIAEVLEAVMTRVGVERFAGIGSDSTGNTRLAREITKEKFPWIYIMPDPCHHLSLLCGDISRLEYWADAISTMKGTIKYFSKSTHSATHLSAVRVTHDVNKGLEKVGKTRFGTIYWSGYSVKRCWDSMKQLVDTNIIDAHKESSPLHFMTNLRKSTEFTIQLTQLVHVLEPVARAIKCLEGLDCTAGDVWKFYVAIVAVIYDLFEADREGYPAELKEAIRAIVNTRFEQMMGETGIYLTVFFLSPENVNSQIFRPSLTTEVSPTADISDQDLRDSIPVYSKVGLFLVQALYREYELLARYPRMPDALSAHPSSTTAIPALRQQYESFVRQLSPFNVRSSNSEDEYWQQMLLSPHASILAYLVMKLRYISPTAVVEERTMSNFTQLNTSNRASQKASSVVHMTQIRQHYRRERKSMAEVRF